MAASKRPGGGEGAPKKRASGPSGPSGQHRNPQRLLSQLQEQWAEQDAHAAARGQSWSEWAREALEETLRRQRARKK